MRRPAAWLLGAFAAAGLLRRRQQHVAHEGETGPDPRADELRRKLAESRAIVEEREEFEAAEAPVDEAEPATEVDERRRRVHERGRSAASKMRDTGAE